jgi:hypothetical protein
VALGVALGVRGGLRRSVDRPAIVFEEVEESVVVVVVGALWLLVSALNSLQVYFVPTTTCKVMKPYRNTGNLMPLRGTCKKHKHPKKHQE